MKSNTGKEEGYSRQEIYELGQGLLSRLYLDLSKIKFVFSYVASGAWSFPMSILS